MVLTLQLPVPATEAADSKLFFPYLPAKFSLMSLPYYVNAGFLSEMESRGMAVPGSLAPAVMKRKVEFAAGRYCARAALHEQGCQGHAPLAIGPGRAPLWPAGYLGSISHAHGLAIAAAASRTNLSGVGIDIERPLKKDVAQSFVAQMARSAEMEIGLSAGLDFEHWATLVFSAKESLYKALYPQVGRCFNFHDVEVWRLQTRARRIDLRLVTTISPHCPKGAEFTVRYTYIDSLVATLCLLSAAVVDDVIAVK